MKIAVLCGGASGEAEISRLSGTTVAAALAGLGHEVLTVEFRPDALEQLRGFALISCFQPCTAPSARTAPPPRCWSCWLPYVGSGVLAGALAMNKAAAKRVWTALGLPTPPYEVIERYADLPERGLATIERLGLPLVVKPNSGGSSLGLSRAHDPDSLLDGVVAAMRVAGPDRAVLVEAEMRGVEGDGGGGRRAPGGGPADTRDRVPRGALRLRGEVHRPGCRSTSSLPASRHPSSCWRPRWRSPPTRRLARAASAGLT